MSGDLISTEHGTNMITHYFERDENGDVWVTGINVGLGARRILKEEFGKEPNFEFPKFRRAWGLELRG